MKKSIAAEEKLLKLIRKKDQSVGKVELAGKNEKNKSTQITNSLKNINKLLLICIIILSGYLIKEYFFDQSDQEDRAVLNDKQELVDSDRKGLVVLDQKKDFSYYLDDYESSTPFVFPWDKEVVVEEAIDEDINFKDLLKIVGIVLDANPQVIIEDLELKQTFFVLEGKEIRGAVVETIQADKIILSYKGKKFELNP